MASMGVPVKQTDKARQAFERSAQQSGFFAHGTDRLVLPAGGTEKKPAEPPATSLEPAVPKVGGGGGGGDGTHHPFIQGLLQKLPPPESNWEDAERVKWLDAAVRIFNLMYQGGSDTISVEVKK